MIDTHTHLFVEEFTDDFHSVIERAKNTGITHLLMPNIDENSVQKMIQVCNQYPGLCFPMIGFHPTSVDNQSREKLTEIKKLLVDGHPFVAIGEVGMDLYWDQTYLREQQEILDEQIQWALEWDLPLVLHCREAFDPLFEVLGKYRNTSLKGVFHSFTGTQNEMDKVLEYAHFMVGINGVVTFKKSNLPQILQSVPLNRLVLETDSPYLAPSPYRGKRNESSYLIKVAEKLAEIYNVTLAEIDKQTTLNALKVFKRVE